jgi:NTE family protein
VETLRDIQARWASMRQVRDAIKPYPELGEKLSASCVLPTSTSASSSVVQRATDKAERDYLNTLPTSFVLDDEAVDRLRLAAKDAILASPEIKRLIDNGALRMVGPGRESPRQRAASQPAK